jgi:glycosyltransferase involved in cell wall biosynthesis
VRAVSELADVDLFTWNGAGMLGHIAGDCVALPWARRGHDLAHFPSYPPGWTFPLSHALTTIHDMTWWRYPETASRGGKLYYRPLAIRALARSRAIVTVSDAVREELEAATNRPVRVVSNVCEIDQVTPASGGHVRPYFLAVGSIEPRKNLHALVEAYQHSGVAKDFDMVLVGRQAWGAPPEGVTFTGPVSDGLLRWRYEHATALFAASLYEGFGLPVAEAVALGTPVYCSDIPAFAEAGQGQIRGLFDPTLPDSIVAAFRDAAAKADDPRPTPANAYSLSRMAAQIRDIYAEFGD